MTEFRPEQEAMLAEWKKKATPAHVAQYVTRHLPDDSEAKWQPFRHHLYMNDALVADCTSDERTFLNMSVAVRMGKALADNESVLTFDGWKKMGELRPGDHVYAPDGSLTRVLAVAPQAPAPIHRLHFDDDSTVDAHPEHEWVTLNVPESSSYQSCYRRLTGNHPTGYPTDWWAWRSKTGLAPRSRTSVELAETVFDRRGHRNHRIPVTSPIQGEEADLPIDPWVLGYWLGNGAAAQGEVTCGSWAGGRDPDIDWVKARIESAGWRTHRRKCGDALGVYGLLVALRKLGVLGNKHVPDIYLRASEGQRRELLAGLMDSDGTVERSTRNLGRVSFTSTDIALVDAVEELLISLGAKATRDARPAMLNGEQFGIAYRVGSSPPFNPFTLQRKAEGWREGNIVRSHRMLRDVEILDPAPSTCIQVDHPSGMFLAGRSLVPTHNSLIISKYLPFWYLGLFPDRDVVIIMNSTDNAEQWGLATRNLMREYGPELFGLTVDPSNDGKRSWGIKGRKGTFRAVGIGTAIEGRGIHLGIIDDPMGFQEAMSPTERQKVWDWYTGQYRTRLMPGATTILVMSRWHLDDLAGRIEAHQAENPGGDPWRTINLPVIAQAPKGADLETWRNPIGQRHGEALWPERWPLEDLAVLRRSVTAQTWESRYMQNPTIPEGGAFKVDNWMSRPYVDESTLRVIRMWDLAATEGAGDWTVGAKVGVDRDNRVYILDIQRFRKDAAGVKKQVLATAKADGRHVPIGIEQERAGSGKAQLADMKRLLFGYVVRPIKPDGKKEDRAAPYAAQQQDSNVYIVGEPEWKKVFIEEHRVFPRGAHDDIVDACSAAFNELAAMPLSEIIQPEEYEPVPIDRMMELGMGGARQEWVIPVG